MARDTKEGSKISRQGGGGKKKRTSPLEIKKDAVAEPATGDENSPLCKKSGEREGGQKTSGHGDRPIAMSDAFKRLSPGMASGDKGNRARASVPILSGR